MVKEQLPTDHKLFLSSLANTGDLLTTFSEGLLFTFSAKDIKTRKLFIHNKPCAETFGLGETDLVGMTSYECLERITHFKGKGDALKRWEKEDMKVIAHGRSYTKVIPIIDHAGFLRVRQHFTVPVYNLNKQIVATAAFCYDRTDRIDLCSLFKQYQKHYPKKKATQQLCKYLGLDQFLKEHFTPGELYTLLVMVKAHKHKQAAFLLSELHKKKVAPATVSGYVESIKNKTKPNTGLDTLLIYLRGLSQWIPDPNIF